ncbi:hypothetical protein KMI_01g00260 [Encephalitozoon hellem]|nr:hypothetical protein KMI_01g00260 [Encephalitozoon hellem]
MKSLMEKLIMYRKDIMDVCINLGLPMTVRSTSIQIFDKTIQKILRDEKEMKDVVYAIVILASKCEEIHGSIDALIKKLPGSNKESILNYESEMFEALDYNFHFPSLYLRMYGVLAMLQEKGAIRIATEAMGTAKTPEDNDGEETFVYDGKECVVLCIDKLWASSVQKMDKILLLDKESYKEIELVYASLLLPCEVFSSLAFPFNQDNVTKLRSACRDFRFPAQSGNLVHV